MHSSFLLSLLLASAPAAVPPLTGNHAFGDALHLRITQDGSIRGFYSQNTAGGKFSCGFLLASTGPSKPDGTIPVVTWWPYHLVEPDAKTLDDEVARGTLKLTAASATLQLPAQAHGGCWNVDSDLDQGKPDTLDLSDPEPAWTDLFIVKPRRLVLQHDPVASSATRPYVTHADVVTSIEQRGPWSHVRFASSTGWVRTTDLIPFQLPAH